MGVICFGVLFPHSFLVILYTALMFPLLAAFCASSAKSSMYSCLSFRALLFTSFFLLEYSFLNLSFCLSDCVLFNFPFIFFSFFYFIPCFFSYPVFLFVVFVSHNFFSNTAVDCFNIVPCICDIFSKVLKAIKFVFQFKYEFILFYHMLDFSSIKSSTKCIFIGLLCSTKFQFVTRRWWSLPTSAPLCTLTFLDPFTVN